MDERQRNECKEIGMRIRAVRIQKQMSQADVAAKASVSLSQYNDIENGKCAMRLPTFIRITEALQVSADLLIRSDNPVVNSVYKREFAEALEECTPSEIDAILRIVNEVKRALHVANLNKE